MIAYRNILYSAVKLAPRTIASKHYSSGAGKPVKLAYEIFHDKKTESTSNESSDLLILHGLFGHKGNWRSFAQRLNQGTGRRVITVDARNHGESPHSNEINFYVMVDDLVQLMTDLDIQKPAVLGHSMGGRTAMCLALVHPKEVEKIVVVDVAPRKSRSTLENIPEYLKAMKEIVFDHSKSLAEVREQADNDLKETIEDDEVRQFIITNLVDTQDHENRKQHRWLINIDGIAPNLQHLQRMPSFNRAYHADALFLAGTRSLGVTKADYLEIHRLFPRARVIHIEGAGHWVHHDKPERFYEESVEFLNLNRSST